MFILARNFILAALVARASIASVVPKSADVIVELALFPEINFGGPETLLPVNTESCSTFIGDYNYLNKAVSSAIVPIGYSCTFFENFYCNFGSSYIKLNYDIQGYPDFSNLPFGESFNKLASSVSCAAEV